MGAIEPCDVHERGFGWIEAGLITRTAHALVADGGVWLVDPFDWDELDARVEALGRPAGVLQLLDRHARDCAAVALRLGVPHHVVPLDPPAGSPFELVPLLERRHWHEVALWWPAARVLVCAEAIGSASYFRAAGEEIGVHPFLRLKPPRRLLGLAPDHLLFGHGRGLHGSAVAAALDRAVTTARRKAPRAWLGMLRKG